MDKIDRDPVIGLKPVEKPEEFLDLDKDTLKDEAEFLLRVFELTEILRLRATPVRYMHRFTFLPQEDTVYAYPEALKDRLMTRSLTGVEVSLTSEVVINDQDTTDTQTIQSTSIEFMDEDGSLYTSRDSEPALEKSFDAALTEKGIPTYIEAIPSNEMNAFLLSLIQLYSESELTLADTNKGVVDGHALLSSLEMNAIQKQSSYEFKLITGRTVTFDTTTTGKKERLESFSIQYATGGSNVVRANIDRQKGLNIDFKLHEEDAGETTPLFPDGGDYLRLIEVINQEIEILEAQRKPVEVELGEDIPTIETV